MSITLRADPRENLAQQAALARFGEYALRSDDLDLILQEACRLVAEALGTELAKVVALGPDGTTLTVRAGIGWAPGVVGELTTDISCGPEGLALRSGEAVVSPDLAQETRFEVPEFMRAHGCLASICVVIVGVDGAAPYGVLQVDSQRPKAFGEQDVAFLRTYANLLASAVGRMRANARLRRKADDNERLLRELQHRVKNNLQVIVAILDLQSRQLRAPESRAAMRSVARRVEALRLLHDKLHLSGEVDELDLGEYLAQLSAGLLSFHEGSTTRVQLALEVERGLLVSPDQAAPLGLAVNEFITNSLKHAFGGGIGRIGLVLARHPGQRALLRLSDDGQGLPVPRPKHGTGMRMIENFGRQLGSAVHWSSDGTGTRLEMTIRLRGT
ncbi:sensor histidine kinase [Falsiroseomonas sp.]|uniref:sensor histidine kinase n=1 Tax=Falsiroseomonas sp. TaxID=2870721 RepID=UPI002716614D|nr:histidine kinase dimerization/phosphoacceptor domain -containing protein [Falsiroseomonas sp.]MDO9498992.1 histidine kinase dimerization/phosphoacceptor domain -containing protein [Falsiroseomonas sp.]